MQPQNPYTTPASAVLDNNLGISDAQIDALPVSPAWKERFKAIFHAGGPKLPKLKTLSKDERKKAFSLNFLAFFLGPIYYIAKGMWKKAITYLIASCVIIIALGLILDYFGLERISNALRYGASAFFAIRANIDFYKKVVLNENGWW
jgi:hypothetical protein